MGKRARSDGRMEFTVRNHLVQVGCWHCDEICPLTDETTPRLTQELAEQWMVDHKKVCPVQSVTTEVEG